jgi:hypothetical protein
MTRCAAACGRDLPDEELIETGGVLVCGPCHESIAKQAERRDSIDDAWRAVEATLPIGWRLTSLARDFSFDDERASGWSACAEGPGRIVFGELADEPSRALRNLVHVLTDPPPAAGT